MLFGGFVVGLVWEFTFILPSSGPNSSNGGGELSGDARALQDLEQRLEKRLRSEILLKQASGVDASERHQELDAAMAGELSGLRAQLDSAQAAKDDAERRLVLQQSQSERAGDGSSERLSAELSAAQQSAAIARDEAAAVKAEAEHWHEQVSSLEAQLRDNELARLRLKASLDSETERATAAAASAAEAAAAAQSAMAQAVAAGSSGGGVGMGGGSGGGVVTVGGDKWYEKPGYGKLISPYEFHRPLPPLIEAWRNVKVDWHDLIPQHSSLWERYGESKDDKFNFMKLVMKEIAVTDYLTQYKDSGLSSNFGRDFGPMRNYSSCNLVDDPCMIHGEEECGMNSFCGWNLAKWSCESLEPGSPKHTQAHNKGCTSGTPRKLVGARLQPVNDPARECSTFINERLFIEHVQDDPATMFYHWWRYFKEVHARVRNAGAMDKMNHFLLSKPPNTQFFHYFGLLSNFCWRRTTSVPAGTCFCHGVEGDRHEGGGGDLISHLTKELNLNGPDGRPPAPERVRIGILSRRRKRFILNEHELVEALLKMGYDVQLLPMEEMTLYEQIKALRQTTVLVGIHGSGLNNAILLPSDSVLVQLLPFKLNYKGAFSEVARENGVHYLEWASQDPKRSYFHWEFLGEREMAAGKEAVLARGSPRGGAEVYTFWINQDVIVPVDEFTSLIRKAVEKTGKLNPELAVKQGLGVI